MFNNRGTDRYSLSIQIVPANRAAKGYFLTSTSGEYKPPRDEDIREYRARTRTDCRTVPNTPRFDHDQLIFQPSSFEASSTLAPSFWWGQQWPNLNWCVRQAAWRRSRRRWITAPTTSISAFATTPTRATSPG
jgi:hypothetical protein